MIKVGWDRRRDGVVVGIVWGVRGWKRGRRYKDAFRWSAHALRGIRSLFQGHSPGGATV